MGGCSLGAFCGQLKHEWRGIVATMGVTLVLAVYGTCYSSGNMSPYLTSYLRNRTSDSDITYTKSVWIFTTANSSLGFFAILGGIFARCFNLGIVILVGSIFQCTSIFLTGCLMHCGFVPLIFVYGLMQGFGVGIAYPLCLKYAQLWYPNKSGLITGISMAGFGSGSFIINFVQTALINPDNLSADLEIDDDNYFDQADVLDNVPTCFLILGVLYATCSAIGIFLMTIPVIFSSEEQDTRHSVNDFGAASQKLEALASQNVEGNEIHVRSEVQKTLEERRKIVKTSGLEFTPKQVLKNRSFWVSLLVLCFHEVNLIIISNYYKTYGQTFISDDSFLTLVGSMASVANALGRLFWGVVLDHSNFKTSMVSLSAVQGLLAVTIPVSSSFSLEWLSKAYYLLWVCGMFANCGGVYVLTPSSVSRAFGMENFAVNYGIIFCISGTTGFLLTEFVSLVLDNTDGWTSVFLVGSATALLCETMTILWNIKDTKGNIL